MEKFIIGWGLSGGFGGVNEYTVVECKNEDEAQGIAYIYACDCYESYEGLHGLRDISDIIEEEGLDENDAEDENTAWEIYREEREDWLAYIVYPHTEENVEKYL